jgi:hypothetical protein
MSYDIWSEDRALFQRCRRAWDLGARARRDLVPVEPPPRLDLGDAVRAALAVYYFPGMWDWDGAIVLPLVRQAFRDAMAEQRARLPSAWARRWSDSVALGERVLESYFSWAPDVDDFAPVRVATDLDVQIPDPDAPGRDLVTPGGWPIRFRTRLDLLAIDADNAYWMVEHELVRSGWPDLDELLLDERALSWCWACQQAYPGLRVAGTIHNELRVDAAYPEGIGGGLGMRGRVRQHDRAYDPPIGRSAAPPTAGPKVRQRGGSAFRRTRIRREQAELASFGDRLACQAREMTDPALRLYPSPSPGNCRRCAFRPPCIGLNEGGELAALLAGGYRRRSPS